MKEHSTINTDFHRCNVEATDNGLRLCRGLHDKNAPCEWEEYDRPTQSLKAVDGWIDPHDKNQTQWLPWISERVFVRLKTGGIHEGFHTGGCWKLYAKPGKYYTNDEVAFWIYPQKIAAAPAQPQQTEEAKAALAWECYCDLGYYHLWAVRPTHERSFNSQYLFHVQSKQEAEALCKLLNQGAAG